MQESREPSQESDMFSSPFLSADLDDSWLSSLVAELLPEEGLISNVSSAHSAAMLPQVSSWMQCIAACRLHMSAACLTERSTSHR